MKTANGRLTHGPERLAPLPTVSLAAASAPATYEEEFPIKSVVRSKTNPRKTFDPDELAKMAASVQQHGVLEPLLVRPLKDGRVELIAGERRLRAAEMAGVRTVPVRILDLDDKTAAEVQLVENLQRADVDPFEQADGFQRLIDDHGYTVDKLAQRLGWSTGAVYSTLKLRLVPEKARTAVKNGTISVSIASLIGRVPNEALRKQAADHLAFRPISFKDAKAWIERELTRELKGSPFDQADAHLTSRGPCTTCPCKTGNARDLYPDGRADICTDTSCYTDKVKAAGQRMVEAAKKAGRQVIEGKKGKELFNPYSYGGDKHDLHYNASYVDVDGECRETQRPSKWSTHLLPDCDAEIVIAIDPAGLARRLISKARAAAVLKKKGIGRRATASSSHSAANAAHNKEREELARKKAINRAVNKQVAAAVYDAVVCDKLVDGPIALIRAMTKYYIREVAYNGYDNVDDIAELHSVRVTDVALDAADGMVGRIDYLSPAACIALLCQFVVWDEAYFHRGEGPDELAAAIEKYAQVDRVEIAKRCKAAAAKDAASKPKKARAS